MGPQKAHQERRKKGKYLSVVFQSLPEMDGQSQQLAAGEMESQQLTADFAAMELPSQQLTGENKENIRPTEQTVVCLTLPVDDNEDNPTKHQVMESCCLWN